MRLALISDIHGNLPALESVLEGIRKHAPDRIISLGDQVNLGPSPREVLALLKAENVTCLHGNHERYILSAMADDPAYAGANFSLLRYHRDLLSSEDVTFPKELRMDGAIFCHAMPGDDRFPVFHVKQSIEKLRQMEFAQPTHIFCGHGHNPTHIRIGNLTLESIGSVGCMDDGVPGTAPYVILDIERDYTFMRPYYVSYDVRRMPGLFRQSGMAEHSPIMAHIACLQMMRNADYICPFVDLAGSLSKAKGEAFISKETWSQADRAFPWPDGIGTREFWKSI